MISRTARRRTAFAAIAACALVAGAGPACADDYPSRPIRFLVGFAAGGSSDIVARVIAQKMAEILGAAIPVENRTGANGTIAMRVAKEATPDGYTMTIAGATVMAINPHTTASLGYDPVRDFIGVATVSKSPIVIAVNPSVPARSLKELIAVSQAGDLTMGSSGVGGIAHLTIEMFNAAGGKAIHIPYTGGAPAATDVVAGHTRSLAMDLAPLQAFIADGRLRAIAVVGESRSIMLPDVPTAIEQGYPRMSADNWYAIVVPAGTPQPVVAKLHAAALRATRAAEVKEKLANIGSEPLPMASPADFPAFLQREIDRWGAVVKAAGLEKQ
ncbi:MAG TPA: tripartite tricarboxylate transporter substrate binding protein [Xanthobacteraceae bacterium]|nr:tripartite tricarboxylate transporter substrate binding protein [Xanthobacteraceae bacterium]